MKVIIGLGNPGNQYKDTYHNVGFMAVERFAKRHSLSFSSKKYNSKIAKGNVNGNNIILLQPQTYMNLSGRAVAQIVNKLKLPLKDIIVICDDVDLDVGTVRFRKEGSGGTHNGLKNIVIELGSTNFPRIKIGVGRDEKMPLERFVLSKISKSNKNIIEQRLEGVCDIIDKFIATNGELEGETIT